MRKLSEIVEAVQGNEQVTEEELRYALCAVNALAGFDTRALRKLYSAEVEGKRPFLVNSAVYQADESHKRWKAALAMPPKEFVGWNDDPVNPDYQERRRASAALFEKVIARMEKTE